LRSLLEAADLAGDIGAQMIVWPGSEGYNYPFQTPYAEVWSRFIDGIAQVADRLKQRGRLLFLEHKNSEPAMKILMRNIGMTLHVIHKLRARGLDNVQVNMDWQHLIMNGENLAEYAALLAAEGLLGHQHANSGWGVFDDDNMVGATAFMETLELGVSVLEDGLAVRDEHALDRQVEQRAQPIRELLACEIPRQPRLGAEPERASEEHVARDERAVSRQPVQNLPRPVRVEGFD